MVLVEQFRHLGGQRRRDDGLGQDAQARALPRLFRLSSALRKADERLVPGPRLAEIGHGLRAVGIVEARTDAWPKQVGGAEAGRVLGVALDLGRPALVALDQQAGRRAAPAAWRWRRTAACPAPSFRLPNVGHDLLAGRLCRAAGQARQGQRGAHQLRKRRRVTGSVHSDAWSGNSRCINSWNSGVSRNSSRLRQSAGRSARRGAEAPLPNQQAWSCSSNGCGPLAP